MNKLGKKAIILFILRLFFYFSVTGLVLIHPGISVSFDRIGTLQWFIIVPIQILIAFLPSFSFRSRCIVALLTLALLSVLAGGFSSGALEPFLSGLAAFILTYLLFHHPRWAKIAALEPFFLAWICLRLLSLSRSGEDAAGQSIELTQFILIWTIVVFLLHSVVVYFCLYPQSSGAAWKEGTLFALVSALALALVLFVLPADFVRNTVIENLIPERIPERIRSDSEHGMPQETEGRRNGRRTIPLDGKGGQPGLRGISEHSWQNKTGRGSGNGNSEDNRQYMVMIVASDREPVYMGSSFNGQLDPVKGFLASDDEPLNRLAYQRFFVTWFNNEPNFDTGRRRQEVFSLSTLSQKYLPYRPLSIDPTILSEGSGPLRYIHQVVSGTHYGDPLRLIGTVTRHLSDTEKSALAPYLELSLEKGDMDAFDAYLNSAINYWQVNREEIILNDDYLKGIFSNSPNAYFAGNSYLEKILAILISFSKYQYNLSYNDDYSIASLKEFLFKSAEGDCVEFSNTLALLGRLAGIPSRVVTGYLAAENLQTPAHLRGLFTLRNQIKVLQEYPFENLFMVTNLHSHSWTQFYIPGYGWLDFEATSFSIPPVGMGDFNTWDVVIPIIDDEKVFSAVRKFPWQAVFRTACVLAAFLLLGAYALRYGRELVLFLGTRNGGREGARSLYLLLLARLAADGKPIKPASKTAHEYHELFFAKYAKKSKSEYSINEKECPALKAFAGIYSELRWRQFTDASQMEERFQQLTQEYHNILNSTRRRDPLHAIKRVFSLRGLAYL
ncbi:MAG: transglutaminase-like domain-containing protein [Treponema sp.]|nr:transglutaminase-like domain-containing protein [Treponema sp.]